MSAPASARATAASIDLAVARSHTAGGQLRSGPVQRTVEIGQEIRREQFAAVAVAIRFAEKMREKAKAGW